MGNRYVCLHFWQGRQPQKWCCCWVAQHSARPCPHSCLLQRPTGLWQWCKYTLYWWVSYLLSSTDCVECPSTWNGWGSTAYRTTCRTAESWEGKEWTLNRVQSTGGVEVEVGVGGSFSPKHSSFPSKCSQLQFKIVALRKLLPVRNTDE